MTELSSLARLIRSKNAGPFQLTFDIMFETNEVYDRARPSGACPPELMGSLFSQPPADVDVYFCTHARAIKISMPRPCSQGDIGDSDGHGGQQYAPLMGIEIA
jgi:hypothetical protein